VLCMGLLSLRSRRRYSALYGSFIVKEKRVKNTIVMHSKEMTGTCARIH